jgi:hypothetical protein
MIDNGSVEINTGELIKKFLFRVFINIKTAGFFLLVWLGLTAYFFLSQRAKFNVSYSISSDYMSGQKMELIYADIKKLILLQQYDRLASLLELPLSEIKKIANFSVEVEEPVLSMQNYNNLRPDFHFNETNTLIQLSVTDTTNLTQIINSLTHFISTSNYFQKIKRNELASMEKINANLELEKKEMDSLNKINLQKFMQAGGSIILLSNLADIKKRSYEIEERLINNRRGLIRIENPVNLINYPIVKNASWIRNIVFSGGFGLIITLACFGFFWIIIKIRKVYGEYSRSVRL